MILNVNFILGSYYFLLQPVIKQDVDTIIDNMINVE